MPFKFATDYLDTPPDLMGGFDLVAYIALVDWIVEWPELPAAPASDDDLVTLINNFVMASGHAFIQVSGRSGLTAESQGERDCTSVKNTGQLFRAGTHSENIALHRKLNDAYGVIIFTDGPQGDDRTVVGDKIRPAWFTAKVDYGTNAEDPKGVTINYDADSFVAGYKYNGDIPTLSGPSHQYTVAADPSSGIIPAEGGYIDVTVSATRDGEPYTDIRFRSSAAWLTAEFREFNPSGDSVFRITNLSVNLAEIDRAGNISFYPAGSTVLAVVTVLQSASVYAISVDPVDIAFPPSGGVQNVTVNATRNGQPVSYVKKSSPTWLTAVPGSPAVITAGSNPGNERSAEVVWSIPGSIVTAVNTVLQSGIVIPDTYIGVVDTAYPTAADIQALPVIKSNNTDVTHSFTTVNEWVIICEPATFDPFVEVIDQAGFNKTNSFRTDNITIAGAPYRFMMYAPPLATTESNKIFTFKK